jgi:hypothetical protein
MVTFDTQTERLGSQTAQAARAFGTSTDQLGFNWDKKMGLLDNMSAPQQAPQQGGLLAQQEPQGNDAGKQLATMLMQSPTPETVGAIIKQLQGSQIPDADKWTQFLPTIANDPDKLKQVASMILNG